MKVVLISQQGSGTNLLRALLNSNCNIEINAEIFSDRYKYNDGWDRKEPIKKYLDKFFNSHYEVKGFDLKYNQITDEILDYIEKNNIKVILLSRDPARTFLRHINELSKRSFKYEEVIEHCKKIRDNERKILNRFDCLHIRYEEMTLGKEIKQLPIKFENKILEFLKVDNRLYIKKFETTKDLKRRY